LGKKSLNHGYKVCPPGHESRHLLTYPVLYDNQNSLGILLPIAKEFMLTIPSIVDNPYVQIDVRVLILFYGALHQGMLLSPGIDTPKKSEYSTFLYRRALCLMEDWQRQEQTNELSLHVAFWMVSPTGLYL
jgi:hypothetical protein